MKGAVSTDTLVKLAATLIAAAVVLGVAITLIQYSGNAMESGTGPLEVIMSDLWRGK